MLAALSLLQNHDDQPHHQASRSQKKKKKNSIKTQNQKLKQKCDIFLGKILPVGNEL